MYILFIKFILLLRTGSSKVTLLLVLASLKLQLLATCYFCLLTVKRNVPLLNQWRGKVYNQSTNRLLFAPFPLAFCEAINNDCLNLRLVNIFLPNLIPFFNSRDGSGGDGIDSTICVKMPGTRWSNEMEQWNGKQQKNKRKESEQQKRQPFQN